MANKETNDAQSTQPTPKKNALGKLKSKLAQNGASQVKGITDAKNRVGAVKAVDEYALDIELISSNPYQPRKIFDNDKILELAESINANGLIAPIAVRQVDGKYQIIAGERRLRACQHLGHKTIQAVIFDADDESTAVMALSENIDREGLTDYEVGMAISSIQHLFNKKTELVKYTGRTRSDVYRYLAYNDLPDWLKTQLNANPSLINRTNATLLVSLFSEESYNETEHKGFVVAALEMLSTGALTQKMLIPKIRRLIRDSENPRRMSEHALLKQYSLQGKKIGSFSFDDNKVVIKLNSQTITSELADKIYKLVADTLSESEEVQAPVSDNSDNSI